MQLRITGLDTDSVRAIQVGCADANGQAAVRTLSEGGRSPCRHCLGLVAEGEPMLILNYRPFPALQPFAESGPIFLHAETCERHDGPALPDWFDSYDTAVLRGYDRRDWIVYETGEVTTGPEIADRCRAILGNESVAYVHVRSKFGCYQCRVERGCR